MKLLSHVLDEMYKEENHGIRKTIVVLDEESAAALLATTILVFMLKPRPLKNLQTIGCFQGIMLLLFVCLDALSLQNNPIV